MRSALWRRCCIFWSMPWPRTARLGGRAGRSVYEAFLHALHSGGWQGRRVHTARVEPLYAQPVPVTVQVWEIRRRAD